MKLKKQKEQKIKTISNKVKREINRIEFQSGLREVKNINNINKDKSSKQSENDANLLPLSFVDNLTRAVVENQILTDDFSIYIQHFEIEKTRPLPLYVDNSENGGLLNQQILNENEDYENIKGLETQFAYQVKVHFYVKLTPNYKRLFPDEFNNILSINGGSLEFFEEITGIGSVLSLIIAAINRFLLWDIPSLREYLPIAQEILGQDKLLHQSIHCPVFSYALVKLCKRDDITKAIKENKNYDQVAEDQEIAFGEYCGFDLVETSAKAALYARLRAIKQTGVNPVEYLTQLCNKIEELNILRKARSYLYFYPFSLKAMEGYLNKTILPRYRTCNNHFEFNDLYLPKNKPWSLVAYTAHLTLTKAYLQEGLYRIGKQFIDVIKPHIENEKLTNNLSSCLILAKYELCLFRYYYLTDLQDTRQKKTNRISAISNALDKLKNAQYYLEKRLNKCYVIKESSQSNFYPFFYLLSRVYSHKAKICMFFPQYYSDFTNSKNNPLLEAIRLFEQARIYAARDGDATQYSYWSAYQSWCYLIVAYLGDYYKLKNDFSQRQCLDWSRRLIKHTLICYSSTGKICYQQIKDNGGNITDCRKNNELYEEYGNNKITVTPLIKELGENSQDHTKPYNSDTNILSLDISILKSIKKDDEKSTYLFGTSSSIIIFSKGMLELCEEQKDIKELTNRIEKAIKMFTYCWLMAEDGSEPNRKLSNDNELYIDRIFDKEEDDDSLLRGLYPHRISQFADFGKVFVATCKAILILSPDPKYSDWQEIENLPNKLHQLSSWNSDDILGQKRYNGHLENHFKAVKSYFEQLKQKKSSFAEQGLIEIRNTVVRHIFRIMRGENITIN